MNLAALACGVVVTTGIAFVSARWVYRRVRRVRRLEAAESLVAKALTDGRLSRATGEALLQHLEGLRRQCSGIDRS